MDPVSRSASRPPAPAALSDPRVIALARLIGVVDRLRDPDGCPWDRKQTLRSMAPHLVEEAHEAREAIETGDDEGAVEEAGDVLMVVALICRIAEQEGRFDLARAAELIADKLVRRHPHVFEETRAKSPEEALASWEAIKKSERAEEAKDESALAGIPVSLPALHAARRTAGKAISAGFRWSSPAGALDKLREEIDELRAALDGVDLERDGDPFALPGPLAAPGRREPVEHELGDVLLSAAFLAAYLDLDPESACREALRRFERRFRAMEADLRKPFREHSQDELLAAWSRAKATDC